MKKQQWLVWSIGILTVLGCIDSEPRSVGTTSSIDISDDSNDASDMTESQDDSDGVDLADSDDSPDVSDASDTGDSADLTDALDASDAADAGEATDAVDVSDESDTSDATDSEDESDVTDASDESDSSTGATDEGDSATDATDGSDSPEGTDATDASDGSDSPEGTDATDATDGSDLSEGTDATDATDGSDLSEGTDATDGTDAKACNASLDVCDTDEFCLYAPEDACGTADTVGTCTPYPEICQTIYMPVCGCDNTTYSNKCVANAAGVNVASVGECDDPILDDVCGGSLGLVCGDDEFCDYADLSCGDEQAVGTCVTKPLLCPIFPDPVCGCDGKYYKNACSANSSGVSVSDDTACLDGEGPGGQPCGGFLGLSCSPAHYCAFELAADCGTTDALGTCQLKPKTCDDSIGLSVCACDGNFYPSICEAAKAGFSPAPGISCQF